MEEEGGGRGDGGRQGGIIGGRDAWWWWLCWWWREVGVERSDSGPHHFFFKELLYGLSSLCHVGSKALRIEFWGCKIISFWVLGVIRTFSLIFVSFTCNIKLAYCLTSTTICTAQLYKSYATKNMQPYIKSTENIFVCTVVVYSTVDQIQSYVSRIVWSYAYSNFLV